MAIRARIKSKIKSLLFGSSTSTKSTVASTPSSQPPAFESPVVSTQATQTTTSKVDHIISKVDSAADAGSSTGVKEDSSAQEKGSEDITKDDQMEAAFIVEVNELFPATCAHCDTGTDNNWIRIENKFACASCETAY